MCEQHGIASTRSFALINLHRPPAAGRMALATSFAQRARAEPAAQIAVLMAADVLETVAAIDERRSSVRTTCSARWRGVRARQDITPRCWRP